MSSVKISVVLERTHPTLAAFVIVPAASVARFELAATTTVEVRVDDVELGRRSLLRLDDGRWCVELRRDHLAALGKSPGERVTLVLALASTALPAELQSLLDSHPAARACWLALTDAQRRMLREDILAAKTSPTRERRARRALLPADRPAPAHVRGLSAEPRTLRVRIDGRSLPGRTCGPYHEVSVGLVTRTGYDPETVVPADQETVSWETRVEVLDRKGAAAFRGPAVNGPPHERFLYLSWFGREGRAAPAMFRRAKLRLDGVPASELARALHSGLLVGRLALTAKDGFPVCGSVRPPAIAWSAADD